jgi:imidazolonepropionase-like amidohydrolase
MKLLLHTLFALLSLLTSQASAQTYIVHALLVDVETQTIRPDYTVVLHKDTIVAIGPSRTLRPPAGVTVIDASGKWLMPGLVDAHVHFFQTGGLYTRPDVIDLRKYYPYEKEMAWYKDHMGDQLRRYLACGITTVIDDGATLALLAARDTFAGRSNVPRILMAGPLLSTAYDPTPFNELRDPDRPFYPVNTSAEAVAMTKKEYPYRPDLIKLWYIVTDSNTAADADGKFPMVEAAITEAHAHHYRVAVHATQKRPAQLAVTAGADFLVHGIDDEVVDDTLLRQLKTRGVVVCPTLLLSSGYSATFSQQYKPTAEDIAKGDPEQLASLLELPYLPDSTISRRYRLLASLVAPRERRQDSIRRLNLRKMVAAGVIIATGTDAGNIGTLHASSYYKELRAMQQAGLSNWQILVASTLNGAKALGKEQVFGSIREGKAADLLLLDSNPVEDLSNLERISRVVRGGVFFAPDTLIPATLTDIVQRQDNAFNAHDLEAFLSFYADTAILYDLHGKVLDKGIAEMRKNYSFLNNTPGLHVTITDRFVMGNKVIDHELATINGHKVGEGLAIYFVDGGKISKAWLAQDNEQ